MSISMYVFLALGVALEVLAAALVWPFRGRDTADFRYTRLAGGIGAGLLVGMLCIRWAMYQLIPLTSGVDSLTLLVAMLSFTAIALTNHPSRRSLMLVYQPAITGIAIIAAFLAPVELPVAPKPLSPWLLLLHVVPAFLAYAWFLVAMLTSGVYLYQAARLKRRSFAGAANQLPSLEYLDRTLFALIRIAYPLFVLTLVLGYYWAWHDSGLLGAYWFLSPKILLSWCMVFLYAVAYHGRAAGWLRGPRLANVLVVGIGGLLIVYLLLDIFQLTNYNFWGTSA